MHQLDGSSLVMILGAEPWPAASLQLIGDDLVVALRTGIDGSAELARICADALGERV